MNKPLCSSCLRSERRESAQFAVKGRLNGLPYRANLCAEHLQDAEINFGLEVRSCRRITPARVPASVLREVYSRLCATLTLDAEGIAKLDSVRDRLWVATLEEAGISVA